MNQEGSEFHYRLVEIERLEKLKKEQAEDVEGAIEFLTHLLNAKLLTGIRKEDWDRNMQVGIEDISIPIQIDCEIARRYNDRACTIFQGSIVTTIIYDISYGISGYKCYRNCLYFILDDDTDYVIDIFDLLDWSSNAPKAAQHDI